MMRKMLFFFIVISINQSINYMGIFFIFTMIVKVILIIVVMLMFLFLLQG